MIGPRLKQLREEKGMKQEDLAKSLSVSPSAIGMYERDAREPNNELTIKIASFFNVSVDYLMGKSIYRNYEDYQEAQEFALKNISNLSKEDVQEVTLLLNYINKNNVKNVDEFIHDKISNFDSKNKEILIKIISHLHHKFHDKNIPDLNDSFILDKYSTLNDWEEAENIINIKNQKNDYKLFNIPILGKITAGQPILVDEYIEGYLPVDPNIYGMTIPDDYFYLRISGNSMNLKVKNGDYALIHKQDYAENGDIIVAIVNGDDEATLKKYKKINDELIVLEPQSDDPNYEPIYIDKNTNFQIIGKAIGQFGKF